MDPTLAMFRDGAQFYLTVWTFRKCLLVCSKSHVNPHSAMTLVWFMCGVLWVRLLGPFGFYETINSHQFVTYILTPIFEHVSDYSGLQGKFIKQTNMSDKIW